MSAAQSSHEHHLIAKTSCYKLGVGSESVARRKVYTTVYSKQKRGTLARSWVGMNSAGYEIQDSTSPGHSIMWQDGSRVASAAARGARAAAGARHHVREVVIGK